MPRAPAGHLASFQLDDVGLEAYGLEIVENVPIEIQPNEYDYAYLKAKKERMGHDLHL